MTLGEVKDIRKIARAITNAENGQRSTVNGQPTKATFRFWHNRYGGAGKSSVTDEIVRRYLNAYTDKTIAVISVDPSRKKPAVLCWATE